MILSAAMEIGVTVMSLAYTEGVWMASDDVLDSFAMNRMIDQDNCMFFVRF
jgi:hypothetical protein